MTDQPASVEVVQIMRALLEAIENGEITAETRKEQGAVRQVRGAVTILEALTERTDGPPSE